MTKVTIPLREGVETLAKKLRLRGLNKKSLNKLSCNLGGFNSLDLRGQLDYLDIGQTSNLAAIEEEMRGEMFSRFGENHEDSTDRRDTTKRYIVSNWNYFFTIDGEGLFFEAEIVNGILVLTPRIRVIESVYASPQSIIQRRTNPEVLFKEGSIPLNTYSFVEGRYPLFGNREMIAIYNPELTARLEVDISGDYANVRKALEKRVIIKRTIRAADEFLARTRAEPKQD